MTTAEKDAHKETLETARTAAEKAFRRVIEETADTGLLGPLNAMNNAFANASHRLDMAPTKED